jgi:hypothetical protein
MTHSPEPYPDRPARDPAPLAVLRRTRRTVGGVLVVAAGLSLLGNVLPSLLPPVELRHRDADPERLLRLSHSVLLGVVVLSVAARRALVNRGALRDPHTRASQFHRAHRVAALIGALAAPLGIAVAVALRPSLRELAPFWVAALGTILLAYPRGYELDDFDEPLPGSGVGEHEVSA